MKAIVTVVLTKLPKRRPKKIGIDLLGRLSTDVYSKHKSLLIEYTESQSIQEEALKVLAKNELEGRVSRIEILGDFQ